MKCPLHIAVIGLCLTVEISAQTVDEDVWMMALLQQQAKEVHANDTVFERYSSALCIPLMYAPPPIRHLTDTLPTDWGDIWAIRDEARRYITLHHADLYVSVSHPDRLDELEMSSEPIPHAIVNDIVLDQIDRKRAVRDALSPWRREINLSMQLTQNFASSNWYQGSSNTFAVLGSAKGLLNYRKANIAWENILEWRLGFDRGNGDTLRWASTTDDLFRLYSKLGYQFHTQVYGTFFVEFKTNVWNTWEKNQRFLKTSFLSPIRYTMGLGIDYKPINGLSINLSPATYKLVYSLVSNDSIIDVTAFGIKEGDNILNDVGSSVRVLWRYKPLREIQLDLDFYFFTNYQRIETDLEVTCEFIINRFLSTKLMIHPRYDSTTEIKEGRKTKIQFKELLSVGFSHTFR